MSKIASFSTQAPIAVLRELLLGHEPPIHARMTEPSYDAKYLRVQLPITDADLAAHLAGDCTLACVLQRDEQASIAACDIDVGGEAMVRRVMRAAELRACHAYGYVLDSGQHSGGHVWIFFEHTHASFDLQVLMRDIVTDAQCPSIEVYPNNADLRLPFGLHRRCGRRGTLLLSSSAAPLDLDADLPGALAVFLAAVRRTSDLPVRVACETQAARRLEIIEQIASARPRRIDPDAHWREVIAQFNASTNLVSLLEGYGAHAVYHYAGGKTLLRCAASQDHANGDKHPSLVVEPGRGNQTGRMICGCYCPTCRLHNQPGQVMDAFEVYCRLENITKREAVQRLQAGISVPQPAPRLAPPSTVLTDSRAASHPQPSTPSSAERILHQRLIDIAADTRVQPLDRRVLAYVISHGAHGHGVANATIAAALDARPDSIKRSKRRLRELGYIEVSISTDGRSASVIRLLPAGEEAAVEGGVQDAPPFHVSESTCVASTPGGGFESVTHSPEPCVGDEVQDSASPVLDMPSIARPQRRQGVLRGLLRRGGSSRQVLAWQGELATIQTALDTQRVASVELQPVQFGSSFVESETVTDCKADAIPETVAVSCGLCLADPDEVHPKLSDAQLTALLRDVLEAQGDAVLRPLLGRVSWRFERDDSVTLVCTLRDLAVVTAKLHRASCLALEAILPERLVSVTVQVGQPMPVELHPSWLDTALWMQVPQWLRPQLVASVLIDGRLYGAMPQRTAAMMGYDGVIGWLLNQVAIRLDLEKSYSP